MPKVAFYVYPTAFQNPGGGEVQLLKTKQFIEREGVPIKLFDPWVDRLKDFDILHVFGSVKDCLPMIKTAKDVGIKVVLSTICWYSWKAAWGTYDSLFHRFGDVLRHTVKNVFPAFPSRRKHMMDMSDRLLPNSQSEANQLCQFFHAAKEKIRIIPNGVDEHFMNANPSQFIDKYALRDFILCVGRIEPRKNQLNMIRALKGINIPLVFIGRHVSNYKDYYAACRREADEKVFFLDAFDHGSDLLASAYAASNTFLLASWLETPGLAALEAGLAGAKIVITDQGATREYFQDFATYVPPDNLKVICNETLSAYKLKKSNLLKEHIRKNFLWNITAQKTIAVYRELV